jgi:protein-tyrosine phosphatase
MQNVQEGSSLHMLDLGIITDKLIIGSRPENEADIIQLVKLGITGVLNLQTDSDFSHLGINWSALWRIHLLQGQEIQRVPIVDFNPAAIIEAIPEAVDVLDGLARTHERVYLHCAAGINRSPSVGLAWLVMKKGMKVDDAMKLLLSRRPAAQPYPPIIRHLKSLEKKGA